MSAAVVLSKCADVADARDVREHVQHADGLRRARTSGFARDVQRKKIAADFFGHDFAVRFVAVGDPDFRASLGENRGDGRADAGCAAGDERGFVFQVKHGKSFRRWFETA
jgi:hypothetical protein